MEQIGDYKVLYAACSALSKSSSKITKNLGVSMLRLIWHDVRDKVIAECKTKKIGTEEQVKFSVEESFRVLQYHYIMILCF
mmetsp:Transcript_35518/g.43913  ORF Transcript_35518/g.43913 Transcript_35518/m.43913 type:complete len:81 (+) Transcript_35518:1322-1564(+)